MIPVGRRIPSVRRPSGAREKENTPYCLSKGYFLINGRVYFALQMESGGYTVCTASAEHLTGVNDLPVVVPDTGRLAGYTNYFEGFVGTNDNFHYPMGKAFLRLGVPGVAAYARERLPLCENDRERGLLEGIDAVYSAVAAYFGRYLPELDRRLAETTQPQERERLLFMRENMAVLATGRPRTFAQALQLTYLMWRLRRMYYGGCLGRLDQHLYPFYRRDVEAGLLTPETALELIDRCWEMMNECGMGDSLANVMVGGCDEQGRDVSNDLSVLMLRACRKVGRSEPHINVRYHRNIRQDVLEEAFQLQLLGYGQATFYNDDVLIPAFVADGIPLEYACQYANDGCTEIVFDGLSDINFDHIDAVATFELALNNGELTPKEAVPVPYYHISDQATLYSPEVDFGFRSGETDHLTTYEEFYAVFLRQYRHQVEVKLHGLLHLQQLRRDWESSLLLAGTFESVMDTRRDTVGGGLPMTSDMVFMGSIPTVADCLMGLKRVVFEEKLVDMPTLKQALAANFVGYDWLREACLAAPKFGNDEDAVDQIAADLAGRTCDWVEEFDRENGSRLQAALIGWKFLQESYGVGATPDGRRYGDPIAEHFCATPGRAKVGPTAIINSIAKAPLERARGIAATHISLSSSFLEDTEAGLALLRTLNLVAMDRGLTMLNIAVYDVDTLRKAQEHPEQYTDLIVRVWGFSARFVDLSREMQEHIIHRAITGRD